MSDQCRELPSQAAPRTWYRCGFALVIVIADILAAALFLGNDVFGIYASADGLSCVALGVDKRLCGFLQGDGVPRSVFFSTASIAAILALGLYDPRPLLRHLEQNVRSPWWLALNAAGIAIFVSPYLLVAGGAPLAKVVHKTPLLLLAGGALAFSGLLLWLSDIRRLSGFLRPHHVWVLLAIIFIPFATLEIQALAWNASFLQSSAVRTAELLLRLIGQPVAVEPGAIIGVGDFQVVIDSQCSGVEGITLVTAVAVGYILAVKKELWVKRALLVIPLAAALSWLLNGVRIASLLMIGARVSPGLAMKGFHEYAGWLIFCVLSALMLFAADNIAWIHRDASPKRRTLPILADPAAAQIIPFIVLLVSSLIVSAFFVEPEAGYPLRFAFMAAAVVAFRRGYPALSGAIGGLPIIAGAAVVILWLSAVSTGSPKATADILGPAGQAWSFIWLLLRIGGAVVLVPLIEEMFFRGYLLSRLDFGGVEGKGFALAASSAAFGALHSQIWLAAVSGLVFGLVALYKGRVADAVAAHAVANAGIVFWALWTDNWSVIG